MAHTGISLFFEGNNLERILQGLLVVLKISIIALIIGILLGIAIGILRTINVKPFQIIFKLYLEIFRIIPLLVLLFVFYYILPESLNIHLNNEIVSIIVFVLWISAEMSDIVRGALISVPKVQIEAGKAIGLSIFQQYQYIYFPQGILLMLPATLNLVTRVIKTTSLLLIIGVPEMIKVGQQIIEHYSIKVPTASLWIYGFIFILYFLLCYPLTYLSKKLEKKIGVIS